MTSTTVPTKPRSSTALRCEPCARRPSTTPSRGSSSSRDDALEIHADPQPPALGARPARPPAHDQLRLRPLPRPGGDRRRRLRADRPAPPRFDPSRPHRPGVDRARAALAGRHLPGPRDRSPPDEPARLLGRAGAGAGDPRPRDRRAGRGRGAVPHHVAGAPGRVASLSNLADRIERATRPTSTRSPPGRPTTRAASTGCRPRASPTPATVGHRSETRCRSATSTSAGSAGCRQPRLGRQPVPAAVLLLRGRCRGAGSAPARRWSTRG